MKRFIILSTLILWIALGAFALFYANGTAGSVCTKKADYTLTSSDFYLQFDLNEQAANDRYLGKVIEVSGIVKDISTDANGKMNVTLDGDALFGVTCKLKDLVLPANKISKGDLVTIKGICSGKLMDIVLVNCKIEKPSATQSVVS